MSGVARRSIVSTNLQWPNGVAIDFIAQKLYWTDAGLDKLERSNLDGSYRQVCVVACHGYMYFTQEIINEPDHEIGTISR